jgi:TP901 family phage tail tape measure protein
LLAVGVAAGAAVMAVKSVEMAGDFQAAMTRVQTGAGESAANMKMVSDGILHMAGEVGKPLHELTTGLYMVNSAGYHGAEGLKVLELSAMGAKVGAAELGTVADAVTTALNAYHMGASGAAAAINALIGAEKQGKTNMEALAGSLSKVAPAAAVAGVGLNEVLAAMSTMTAQGTSADIAATYLRQTILQLSNPTQKAAMEMRSLGLNAIDVSMSLGKNGLAATLELLTNAIKSKMGPAGTVLIQQLQKSASSTTEFEKVLANLPPVQQTYIGALANMVGGTKSMQAALQLTGANMDVFKNNIAAINENVKLGGSGVEGWSVVQQNFNQKMAEAKGTIEALRVELGTQLMPAFLQVLNVTMDAVHWGEKHKTIVKDLGVAIGTLAAAFLAYKTYLFAANVATKLWVAIQMVVKGVTLAWTAVQWLLDASFLAFPGTWIVLAIIAIVAAIVYLWTHSAAFRNFFIGIWQHIWSFLKTVGSWFKNVLWGQYLWPAIQGIAHGAMWLWNSAIKPAFGFIIAYAKSVGASAMWLWNNAIKPAFDFIANIVTSVAKVWMWLDKQVISVVVFSVKTQIAVLAAIFTWLWDHAVKPVVDAIATAWNWLYRNVIGPVIDGFKLELALLGAAFSWLYQHVIGPVIEGFKIALADLGAAFTWLWQHAIKPAWDGIVTAATWAWKKGIKPALDAVGGAVSWLGGVFKDIFAKIGGWISSGFKIGVDAVKGYINWMIDAVNKVAGWLNGFIDKINKTTGSTFDHFATIPHLASGGVLTHGGLVEVGEHGAEVVSLPAGSSVYPHGSVPAGAQGGGVTRVKHEVRLVVDVKNATPEMKKWLRKMVRVDGGQDIEVAFT